MSDVVPIYMVNPVLAFILSSHCSFNLQSAVLERSLGMMASRRPKKTILDIGVSNSIVTAIEMKGGDKESPT